MTWRRRGTGGYTPSEGWITFLSSTYKGGGPLVIYCHGGGGDHTQADQTDSRKDLKYLANTGCVVISADLGALHGYGQQATRDAISALRTWAAATWDADISKTSFVADSAGACTALNWAWRNPTLVGALALRVPCVALDAAHDRNAGGQATNMEAAFGGLAAYDAAVPTHDPSHANQVPLIGAIKDRVRVWYSLDDPIILPSDVTSFAAATGVSIRPLGNVNHAPWAAVHAQDQATWIWSRLTAA